MQRNYGGKPDGVTSRHAREKAALRVMMRSALTDAQDAGAAAADRMWAAVRSEAELTGETGVAAGAVEETLVPEEVGAC